MQVYNSAINDPSGQVMQIVENLSRQDSASWLFSVAECCFAGSRPRYCAPLAGWPQKIYWYPLSYVR